MPAILGFTCTFRNQRVRTAIEQVLGQIRDRQPRDFERLQAKVMRFQWLPRDEERHGTMGMWCHTCITRAVRRKAEVDALISLEPLYPAGVHPDRVALLAEDLLHGEPERRPGNVQLARSLSDAPDYKLHGTIAHELGHAATTHDDVAKRDRALGDSEWSSEACADYYAYRWGFGKQIRRCSKVRKFGHHGGLPGDTVHIQMPDGKLVPHRVTRHFYYRALQD